MEVKEKQRLSIGLWFVIGYFLLAGAAGLVLPLTNIGPHHEEHEALPLAKKLGQHARGLTISAAFIYAGVSLIKRKKIGVKIGIAILVISGFYESYAFAWGFSNGPPSKEVLYVSFGIVGAWSLFWISLLYFNRKQFNTEQIVADNVG